MSTQTPESFLLGGGAKSAKFPSIGTVVGGVITDEPTLQQQKDINTGALKTWDDGNPMMQLVVKVQTDEREDGEDDGVRAIYIKGQMKQAVAEAVKKAGAKGLAIGGTLKVAYTGDGEPSKKGFTAPKQYQAQYVAPASNASADFFGAPASGGAASDDSPPF